ncbi:WD repeat-containing and planar cell polarity effector protein fritz isoform X1 [Lucilia cuprina]|uniref:WD repeat-containing and planar cell polarity effector protein fritz isoform X1 n=1 Tax=Lucilia cuprina TaxID=7375 RepID=UPI001F059B45|nr:WD repeat-containing and planar cell polarity effector protein fritz isoform X1 [Lucilia cuprina]XP_046802161.1 WD repeat-containing and planar cell polarity effector protein fritz isoform X1 [Lucilia cuprina]
MLTLLSECHFWTTREDVRIKHTDFGAFRYTRNRELQHMALDYCAEAKRDYTERRNGLTVLKNSRKSRMGRLKDNLKRLEELMRTSKVVRIHWTDGSQVLLLFSNGIIAHICIDMFTGDISRMVYEKYLVGKLAADTITDAFFTRSHIVLAYNTNQVTVVHLQKPNARSQGPEKISHMEPKIFHAIIPGAAERKIARRLSVNTTFDMFVIWTKSSQNEVFPWRPTMRDQDRANIHVFKLKGNQLDFFAYCWSENDPLHVDFLRSTENQILTLEQKISRKGEITAEVCSYEIAVGKMLRSPLSSIPMGTQITTYAFSPDQEKLFLGTVDRNICLHDLVMQTTKCVAQIDIIPTQCSWHSDSSMITIANTRSQFECFDLALTPISNQLQSEDVTPTNLLDLSHYFATQPTLLQISFSRKPEIGHSSNTYAGTDCFLLLLYDQGPIGCLRFFAGAGMRGDIHNSGLTADVILDKYLALNQLEKAVNLLNALNWETYGAMCLISLHKIANHVFYKCDQRRVRIDLMAKALKTFTDSLTEETKDEFSDQVFDLKRRFFFFLLRRNQFAEAFEVAQDIEDYDLFMDLFNITKFDPNLVEFSAACFSQAAAILHEEDTANGNLSTASELRSESACSQSTISDNTNRSRLQQQQQQHQKFLKNYVPPLPSFKSKVFNAEMIKINIPKPELRLDSCSIQQERSRPPPPPVPDKKQIKLNPTTISASTSIALSSNLANLSLKSAVSNSTHHLNTNGFNANPQWADLNVSLKNSPIKSAFVPHFSTNNLVTKTNSASLHSINNNVLQPSSSTSSASYSYLASPIIISDNHASIATQRTYQQPPAPIVPINSYQPKFFQHPLVSGNIPSTGTTSLAPYSISNEEYQKVLLSKKPTASILSNGSAAQNGSNTSVLSGNSGQNGNIKDGNKHSNGEKNKVKFSDTVQVAVVPEIPRKDKLLIKRNGYARPPPRNFTNPKKELQDSLPLCHPNDDYLKDFNPLPTAEPPQRIANRINIREEHQQIINKTNTNTNSSTPKTTTTTTPSIKVVHFGVV